MEALDELMREYKKNVQKTEVKAIGRSGSQSKESKKAKTKKLGKQESKLAKASLSKTTTGLQSTVKGQFGKKITKVFDQQKQMLDEF